MTTTRRSCTATKADGTPCRGWAGINSDFCLSHDPARHEEATDNRRRGGLRYVQRPPGELGPPPTSLEEIGPYLAGAIADVRAGLLDPKQLAAISSGCETLAKLFRREQEPAKAAAQPKIADEHNPENMTDEEMLPELERELVACRNRIMARLDSERRKAAAR